MKKIFFGLVMMSSWFVHAELVRIGPGYVRAPFVRVENGHVRAPFVDIYNPNIRVGRALAPQRQTETWRMKPPFDGQTVQLNITQRPHFFTNTAGVRFNFQIPEGLESLDGWEELQVDSPDENITISIRAKKPRLVSIRTFKTPLDGEQLRFVEHLFTEDGEKAVVMHITQSDGTRLCQVYEATENSGYKVELDTVTKSPKWVKDPSPLRAIDPGTVEELPAPQDDAEDITPLLAPPAENPNTLPEPNRDGELRSILKK